MDQRQRIRDGALALVRQEHAVLRHVARRARPNNRHPAARQGSNSIVGDQRLVRVGRLYDPACAGGSEWALLLDTNIPENENGKFKTGDVYSVTARSVLLFVLDPEN